jgi:hypothetical protein
MEHKTRTGTPVPHVPDCGEAVLAASLHCVLYEGGELSVMVGRVDQSSKRMIFKAIGVVQAPTDLARQTECVLWYAAQVADDASHAPWHQ